jgi:hypothetical protein
MRNEKTGEPKRNTLLLCGSMVVTVALLRLWLHNSPNTDLDVAGYNIHHLFTGLVFIVIGGLPLAIFRCASRKLPLIVFGAGLGMALDEWVFLIATDGSNASYLLPVSWKGAIIVTGLACIYAAALIVLDKIRNTPGPVPEKKPAPPV